MAEPLTDMTKVLELRPQITSIFDPPKPLVGFQALPTPPHVRVMVKRGLPGPRPYPLWDNIDEVLALNGKAFSRFEGIIILGGIGLGYLAEAIASRLGSFGTLAIWEPDTEWIRAACYLRNNTTLLMNRQVQLVIGGEQALKDYIDLSYANQILSMTTVVDTCLSDIYPDRREMMDVTVPAMIANYEGNRSTVITFGDQFFTNMIRALKYLPDSLPIGALAGQAVGVPAIIVGAGPGLNKHYETLKHFRATHPYKSCVVFAADTALKPLLDHGVAPDFVTSVDPQAETAVKYQELCIPESVSLLYHPGTCAEIPAAYPHHKFICNSAAMPPLDLFADLLHTPSNLGEQIQCQVHLAYDTAVAMGCSPIILVGIDLCYYGVDQLYAALPAYLVGLEQEHLDKGVEMTDMHGQPCTVVGQFLQYQGWFTVRAKTVTTINCNEQGLAIPGIPNDDLFKTLTELTGRHLVSLRHIVREIRSRVPPANVHEMRVRLRRLCKEIRFFELIAKNVMAQMKIGETGETRDLVNRWSEKLGRRSTGLLALIFLEHYGHVTPCPIRRHRLPTLVDSLQGAMEWAQGALYYDWLLTSSRLALKELEDAYTHLRGAYVPSVPAMADVGAGTDGA